MKCEHDEVKTVAGIKMCKKCREILGATNQEVQLTLRIGWFIYLKVCIIIVDNDEKKD